ncbi:hypothetical protein HYQ44_006282 [Verticillium longisporum]|nr:hypothetical protein HYQ44_006282 [Verticillium longisporum]
MSRLALRGQDPASRPRLRDTNRGATRASARRSSMRNPHSRVRPMLFCLSVWYLFGSGGMGGSAPRQAGSETEAKRPACYAL